VGWAYLLSCGIISCYNLWKSLLYSTLCHLPANFTLCSRAEGNSPWLWFTQSAFCSECADEVPQMGMMLLLLSPLCLLLCFPPTLTGLCQWLQTACYWLTSSLPTFTCLDSRGMHNSWKKVRQVFRYSFVDFLLHVQYIMCNYPYLNSHHMELLY
jgi:hypothetical protein